MNFRSMSMAQKPRCALCSRMLTTAYSVVRVFPSGEATRSLMPSLTQLETASIMIASMKKT